VPYHIVLLDEFLKTKGIDPIQSYIIYIIMLEGRLTSIISQFAREYKNNLLKIEVSVCDKSLIFLFM